MAAKLYFSNFPPPAFSTLAASPFSLPRFRWLYTAGWLTWSLVHAWVLHAYGWSRNEAISDSLVSNGLLIVACFVAATTLRYYLPSRSRYGFLLSLTAALWVVWFMLSRSLMLLLPMHHYDYAAFLSVSVPVRLAVGMLLLASNVLLLVLWFTLQQRHEDDQRQNEMVSLAREAELFHLKEQLHPHFLFNSLNSINALVGSQPQAARGMIQQLADFLRGTLRKDHQQRNSLQEELQTVSLYLEIEKVRFGHRLQTLITAAEDTLDCQIPAMLLQPVVENAIKFGLYDTIGDITISLQAWRDAQYLYIKVTNPFDSQRQNRQAGTGFGLRSVERRLYLLFGRTGLCTTQAEQQLFTTLIQIPQPS